MTLRNAFATLLTESVEGAVEAVLLRMEEREARRSLVETPRALQYARTIGDAMRVNVDNVNYQVSLHPSNDGTNGMTGRSLLWFGASSVLTVDEREQQRIQSEDQFNQVRIQRWVFT